VLVEPALKGGQTEFAVVGIGVNVRHGADDFPPELRHTATSCALAGVTVTLAQVRGAVLAALDDGYRRALCEGPASLYVAWSGAVSS
jgi:biotin-(acetyl-CoA carboxylase) ligase